MNPFINRSGRIRAGWWIAFFFIVLAALLMPLILAADGGEVPIWRQALAVIAASLICQALRRRPISELVGPLDMRWPVELGIGMLVGAALMLIPAVFLLLFGVVEWRSSDATFAGLPGAFTLFLMVAATEEVLFRGFVFQRLIEGLGVWWAQILIGALFLLTHADAIQMSGQQSYLAYANIFIASLMFGFAFVATKSLAMPIGIHLAANFVQGYVLGFGVSGEGQRGILTPAVSGPDWFTGGSFGLEASAPGLIAVTVFAALLWRRVRRQQA